MTESLTKNCLFDVRVWHSQFSAVVAAVIDWQVKVMSELASQSSDIHDDSDIEVMFPAPEESEGFITISCHCLRIAGPLCICVCISKDIYTVSKKFPPLNQ